MPDNERGSTRIATVWGDLVFEPVAAGNTPEGERERAGAAAASGDASLRARAEAHAARRACTASGRPRAERAAQFMPFAALRGYYDLVQAQQRIQEPRHELTEDEALALSRVMQRIRRGSMVRVTYYDTDSYVTFSGCVARVDRDLRRITVIKTIIAFDDIRALELIDEHETPTPSGE